MYIIIEYIFQCTKTFFALEYANHYDLKFIPACVHCVSSKKHDAHDYVQIFRRFESKKKLLQRDLQELKDSIYPRYCSIVSSIQAQKVDLNKNSQKLTTAIYK